ncbi:MAG: imidazolonepropionase [Bacteroidota bacterium]|jgi:imidazolonepropionase|nr:imidazolonepropionase [Ignavibacteria bacterium]MCU7497730.1 imidazolonepropionase [Ignavibacteria bacterium]MCU7510965.1 imidazolonepropionase [Ignavibacteria bacterium]MCU7518818.1 imidazolonepropionase [Ignavibacteria bacterium]MCU7523212.1 imidazolonepropionase [Ignavibacteria bacterium]
MLELLYSPSVIVTAAANGKNFKRGGEMREVQALEGHSVVIEDEIIKDILPDAAAKKGKYDKIIDLKGKTLLPGLIDCHTHLVFAGSRADEFRQKISGATYEEIASKGGGIKKTVGAVRKTSPEDLVKIARPRIEYAISQGITTLEIKSGYGLSLEDEIKLLRVINHLKAFYEIDIIPTFLGAHTFPGEYEHDREGYVRLINDKMLPLAAKEGLAVFCDAFLEATAFNKEEVAKIFSKARDLGFKIKLHSEQFNAMGGIDVALSYGATSLDHLEMITDEGISKIAATETVCVLLPGVSFFLNYGFAPARKLIEKGAIVALSTDYNPGSSNIANLNLVMSLAAIKMKMTVEEVISAVTINAAKALDLSHKTGSIEIGKKADLAVFDTGEYSDIVYQVGKNLNCMTIKNGRVIYTGKI